MKPGRVVVKRYDPRWPLEFERVRAELTEALPAWVLSIEHVGSTAVPGLDAKPIIDILVGVPSLERGLTLRPILDSLGFEYRVADALPDRHYFPRTRGGYRVHHVSVAEPNSRHYRNTLIFRDALRADPLLAGRYAALKHSLARELGTVRFAYLNAKTDFIHAVMREKGGELGGDYPARDLGRSSTDHQMPEPVPAATLFTDEAIELRLIRVVGPGDAAARPPRARFLAGSVECRFAIHRRSDADRVGRIHLRLTDDPTIVRGVGHTGYEIDEQHRRRGYAARALVLIRGIAHHYGIRPLWVFIEPENTASRRTAERAGLGLVDIVPASPEGLALGLGEQVCRYADL